MEALDCVFELFGWRTVTRPVAKNRLPYFVPKAPEYTLFCQLAEKFHINEVFYSYKEKGAPLKINKNPVPARGKIARYTREISFARCNDEAGAIILHGSAAGNTSRTVRSTLQQHKVQSQRFLQNYDI